MEERSWAGLSVWLLGDCFARTWKVIPRVLCTVVVIGMLLACFLIFWLFLPWAEMLI